MRTSVERLRLGLLAGAGLLVLVIAAFLGYARYRAGRVLANLPGRLGATITREANGITFSQSDGKRTIFTIHAGKEMQHSDGKLTLHDVSMILYGRSGDRADRISGDDFEYDTKAQIVKAVGVVHLDLDATAPGAPDGDTRKHVAAPVHDDIAPGSHVIHVKTSGLVYTRASGTATTDQGLEFAFGGYTGHAVGAVYNATTGHVILQANISMSGVDRGRPLALLSSHGELDRTARRADFRNARYSSAGQVARADTVQLHMREDNSIERVECEGNVALQNAEDGKVNSLRAEILLDPANHPVSSTLTGGVRFVQQRAARVSNGKAEQAKFDFDGRGHVNHLVLHGGVRTEEQGPSAAKTGGSDRTLTSDALEVWLASAKVGERTEVRDAKATGGVTLLTNDEQSGGGATTRKICGDLLKAHFLPGADGPELSAVHGDGNTLVEQKDPDGVLQKSRGNLLDATFRQTAGDNRKSTTELASAVQQGGVVIERSAPAKLAGSDPDVQHAIAQRATFDAGSNLLTLTGDVIMHDAGREVLAAKIVIARESGDATAEGAVKVTYQNTGSEEPIHVLAARAELDHAAGKVVFYGRSDGLDAPGLARLWQAQTGGGGGSQVEAPVLIFEEMRGQQQNSRLTARSGRPGVQGTVHAVLAEANSHGAAVNGEPVKSTSRGAVRIVSSEMMYSDLDRRVDFTGGVRLIDGTGEVKANSAVVFLAPAALSGAIGTSKTHGEEKPQGGAGAAGANGFLSGRVERVVATQRIEITQPGRKATGERLVYTASDQMFVLTGTPSAPPRVLDAVQGSTTGSELRFHSGDNSVVVFGDGPAHRVKTETRVKQ